MWKNIVAEQSNDDFLNDLSSETFQEIVDHFEEVIRVFGNLHSSVYCTSEIFSVGSLLSCTSNHYF